jgi:hypothetical protein
MVVAWLRGADLAGQHQRSGGKPAAAQRGHGARPRTGPGSDSFTGKRPRLRRTDSYGGLTASVPQRQAQMMLELIKGELVCPRFVIFMPPPAPHTMFQKIKSGVKRFVHPRDWFKDKVLLFVVCPCCWRAVDCGPAHSGYKLKVSDRGLKHPTLLATSHLRACQVPWKALIKYAPAIKMTLTLLRVAMGVARAFSIPVPVPDGADVLSELDELVSDVLGADLAQAIDDASEVSP